MKEIKFRAWDIENENMFEVSRIDFVASGKHWIYDEGEQIKHPDVIELMQYTGLKDKNGKEIYEGDRIKIDEEVVIMFDCSEEGTVGMSHGGAWGFGENTRDLLYYVVDIHNVLRGEIIGNIYENPEFINTRDN